MLIHFFLLVCSVFQIISGKESEPKKINITPDRALQEACRYVYQNPDSAGFYLDFIRGMDEAKEDDSLYAAFLNLLGVHQSVKGHNEDAYKNISEAMAIFEGAGNTQGVLEAKLNLGELLYNWGKYDTAWVIFDEVLAASKQNGWVATEIKALNYTGKYYHSKGEFEKSYAFYQKCYTLAQQANDTIAIVSIQNKIGKHFETIGDYPKALAFYLKSESLIQHVHNYIEMGTTYNGLGNMYHALKDYQKALSFHTTALRCRARMKYKEGIAKSLNNLGEVLIDVNELDSAYANFSQSLEICTEIGYTKGIIKGVQNQGVVLRKLHKDKKAVQKFTKSLELSQQVGYDKGILSSYYQLAELHFKYGRLAEAIELSKKGLGIAIREDVRIYIRDFNLILSDIYRQSDHYQLALDYYRAYVAVHDEIVNVNSANKIAELKTKFGLTIKERENDLLKKDNEIKELKLKRNSMFMWFAAIILFLLTLLVIIVYSRFLNKKKANEELKILNADVLAKNVALDKVNKKLKEAKKQQMRLFSIISHELRNPLYWFRNLIQMLSDKIDVLDKDMISKSLNSINESATDTFHLMDNLLNWSRSQLGNITCNPEPLLINELVDENIKLVGQYAGHKKIRLVYDAGEAATVMADRSMIKTVVRNILSNAIKFTPQDGRVSIKTLSDGKTQTLIIEDSGIGIEEEVLKNLFDDDKTYSTLGLMQEKGSGIGLKMSKEFVEKNGGSLNMTSKKEKGTRVEVRLPLYRKKLAEAGTGEKSLH